MMIRYSHSLDSCRMDMMDPLQAADRNTLTIPVITTMIPLVAVATVVEVVEVDREDEEAQAAEGVAEAVDETLVLLRFTGPSTIMKEDVMKNKGQAEACL